MFKVFRKILKKICNFFSKRREIVFISDKRIVNKKLGLFGNFICFLFISWFAVSTMQYFNHLRIIQSKKQEIENLYIVNNYLKEKVVGFRGDLERVSAYLEDINTYDHFDSVQVSNVLKVNNDFSEVSNAKLSDDDVQTLLLVLDTTNVINKINCSIQKRAKGLESIIADAGLSLRNVEELEGSNNNGLLALSESNEFLGQGGPFYTQKEVAGIGKKQSMLDAGFSPASFDDNIEYLAYVEKLVNTVPLSEPMKHRYRVTSKYGARRDPFTGRKAFHNGLDFAGPIRAKIHATSNGRVIFAGRKGAYGKYIEIDHGMGIKTTYGHLAKIMVKKGDMIERGQIVGLQGNTGRSTGDHLHYEVRYKNKTYNPRYFLNSGEELF